MLKTLVAILAAILLTGPANESLAETVLKLGNAFTSKSIITKAVHELCDAINEGTGGRYILDSYDDSKLGSVPSQVKLLNAGNLHFIVSSSGNLSGFLPKIDLLDLPGITKYHPDMASVLNGPTSMEIYKDISSRNLLVIGALATSPRVLMLTRPVKTLEDAQGLKLRVTPSQIHLASMKKLGMSPVPLAWTECYTSLQQRVIEGVDPELVQGVTSSILSVAPYWSKFDILPMTAVIITNRKWWESLPEADRTMLHNIILDVSGKTIASMYEDDRKLMDKLAAEGHPVFVPSEEERNRWTALVKDVYRDFPHIPGEWVEKLASEYSALK